MNTVTTDDERWAAAAAAALRGSPATTAAAHTESADELEIWTRPDLEKIARAPQVVDGGGSDGGGGVDQRIRRSMRDTTHTVM